MDCIDKYDPIVITDYSLPIFAQHRPISACRPLAITDHTSPITDKITAEDIYFITKMHEGGTKDTEER